MRHRFASPVLVSLVAVIAALAVTGPAAFASGGSGDPAVRTAAESVLDLGHRGARGGAVDEDTISSCAVALSGGADGCELDLRRSRDGVVFLLHDATLSRVSRRCHGTVSRMPFWRIQRCHLRHGGVIPTYEQFVTAVAGFAQSSGLHPRLLVEYKAPNLRRGDVARFLATSARHGFGAGQLMVESGYLRMLHWSARLGPTVPRYLINFHHRRVVRSAAVGLSVSGVIVPAANLGRALRRDPGYVDAWHASGRRVMVWGHSWLQGVGAVVRGADGVILDESDRFDAWRDGR